MRFLLSPLLLLCSVGAISQPLFFPLSNTLFGTGLPVLENDSMRMAGVRTQIFDLANPMAGATTAAFRYKPFYKNSGVTKGMEVGLQITTTTAAKFYVVEHTIQYQEFYQRDLDGFWRLQIDTISWETADSQLRVAGAGVEIAVPINMIFEQSKDASWQVGLTPHFVELPTKPHTYRSAKGGLDMSLLYKQKQFSLFIDWGWNRLVLDQSYYSLKNIPAMPNSRGASSSSSDLLGNTPGVRRKTLNSYTNPGRTHHFRHVAENNVTIVLAQEFVLPWLDKLKPYAGMDIHTALLWQKLLGVIIKKGPFGAAGELRFENLDFDGKGVSFAGRGSWQVSKKTLIGASMGWYHGYTSELLAQGFSKGSLTAVVSF